LVRDSRSEQWVKLADVLAAARAPRASVPAPHASVPAPRASVPVPQAPVPAPAYVAAPRASVPAPVAVPQPAYPPMNGDAPLWQVRLASGEVRSGTRQQLAEAFGAGHLQEDMLVLPAGASEWLPLGVVMDRSAPAPARVAPSVSAPPPVEPPQASARPPAPSPPAAASPPATASPGPEDGDEIWLLRLADGQVRSGTRQQLEEAFRAGSLDEGALVLAAGASEWATLGSLARHLSSAPAAPPPAAMPIAAPEFMPVQSQPAPPDVASHEASASAPEEAPSPPADDASSPAPSPAPADDSRPALQAAGDGDPLWQVKLTGKQLEHAFHAGLLGDQTLVLAAGSDQWVPFGEVRRAQSALGETAATNGVGGELNTPEQTASA